MSTAEMVTRVNVPDGMSAATWQTLVADCSREDTGQYCQRRYESSRCPGCHGRTRNSSNGTSSRCHAENPEAFVCCALQVSMAIGWCPTCSGTCVWLVGWLRGVNRLPRQYAVRVCLEGPQVSRFEAMTAIGTHGDTTVLGTMTVVEQSIHNA